MRAAANAVAVALFTTLVVAGCGGGSSSPTAPTGGAGATIAGTVSRASGGSSGLTVSVSNTNLSAAVEGGGHFQINGVPNGDVQLRFSDQTMNASAQIANVRQTDFIEIQVQVNGATATIVSETRSTGKVTLCHRTESGAYQSIDVSTSAEPAHREHGDAKAGEPVPGTQRQVFDENCRPSGPAVEIQKTTNGDDANDAPGPSITVGSAVTWRYIVSNTGTINLTGMLVTDDRGVSVTCPGTTLTPAQSMTCTGSGVATLGQYRNVGSVTASSANGSVTDSDPSHYLGVAPTSDPGEQKIQICHRTGAGFYNLLEIAVSAEPAHRAHGDGKIGEAVPNTPGRVFGAGCSVQ
jgi:hypothetical protein